MNGFMDFLSSLRPRDDLPQQLPQPMQMPTKRVPKRGWQDKAYIIGAGLKDAGGGEGNLDAASAMFGKRDAEAQAVEQRQRLIEQARAVITDPREWMVFETDPEEWAKGYGIPPKPAAPAYVEGPDGIYERGEGGWTKATSYPGAAPKPPERIEGPDGIYERGEDGQWKKVAAFGAAPRVFAPPRVGGGRAASGPKLPTGFILDGN
jgi:hypothetical protein